MPIPTIIDEQRNALITVEALAHWGLIDPDAAPVALLAIAAVACQATGLVSEIVLAL